MNKEHTEELLRIGKILYLGKDKPLTQSLMAFGFECGDGWFYPLKDLTTKLEALNITFGKPHHFHIEAMQVKEKFGTLHFYYAMVPHGDISEDDSVVMNYVDLLAQEYIDDTEKECMNHCEECGTQFGDWNKEDKVMTTGWINILCKECAEKSGRAYKPFNWRTTQ